jgi:phage gp36-like protein
MARSLDYCTADDDVRKLLEKVTDAVMSDADVEYFIERADNYIDSKLAFKYQVPFSAAHPLLRDISANLSAYLVLRTIYVKHVGTPNSTWVDIFKNDAIGKLNELIDGSLSLVDSSGNIVSTKGTYGIKITTADFDATFTEGDETEWSLDSRK